VVDKILKSQKSARTASTLLFKEQPKREQHATKREKKSERKSPPMSRYSWFRSRTQGRSQSADLCVLYECRLLSISRKLQESAAHTDRMEVSSLMSPKTATDCTYHTQKSNTIARIRRTAIGLKRPYHICQAQKMNDKSPEVRRL